MIQKVQRLSDLPVLYNLLAEGRTIVASGKTNFKIKLSDLKGKKIIGIESQDDPNIKLNQIKINFDTNDYQYLYFFNGEKGETGEKGDKGPTGDKGESFNRDQVLGRADDVLVIANDDVTDDGTISWSAFRGKVMEDFIKSLAEIYMTDDEYQLRFNEQVFIDLEFKTSKDNNDSIIIYNDNVNYKTYIKYWTYENESDERYYYIDPNTNEYVEASSSFDIWKDYYLNYQGVDYYTRKLVTTIINQDTGEGTSEWVYTKINVPVWMDLEFETKKEDKKSILIYSDKELGDDGVTDKDPQEEEIIILHRAITSITVDEPNFTMPINEIITKAVRILPTDYLNSPICIEYDEDMVKVFEDGRIMALGTPGETTIKIYSEEDPEILATININVVVPVIDILFDTNIIKAFKNYSQQIHATVLPEDATNPTINWYSSDSEIADVDENGMITLNKEGKVTIYAESTDGTNIVARVDVTVDTAVETIKVKNTHKAIFGIVGTIVNLNDINSLLDIDFVNEIVEVSFTNNNLTYNTRNKNITFANRGVSNIIITNEDNEQYIINVVIDNTTSEIVVKNNTYEILVGHSTKVEADVLPETSSNKRLNWSPISNTTGISIGNESNGIDARIYLTSKDNYDIEITSEDGTNVKEYLTIIGRTPITSLELDTSILSLDLGDTHQLVATVNEDADDKSIIWTSNNPTIVSVDENGFVRSLLGGDAIITATAGDGSGVLATCVVSSVVLITSITINNSQDIDLYAGNEYMINFTITPENAYNKHLIWYTSDENIATINNGRLVALKEGKVKIYAMADDNSGVITSINANISVPTNELLLSDISLTLHVDETYSLIATVLPDNTTNQNVVYESIDPTIASIDIDGNIKALKEGETEIFVRTIDGTNLSQKCTINIIN